MEHYGFIIEDILRLSPEKATAKECVAQADLLFYEREGSGVLSANGKKHRLTAGHFSFVPKGCSYKRSFEESETILISCAIIGISSPTVTVFAAPDKRWEEYFDKAAKLWEEKQSGYYYKTAVLLCAIFGFMEAAEQSLSPVKIADRLKETVDECFADPTFCINELAVKFNVSEVYIRKLFKEAFALSPKEYLQQKRIAYACSLLQSGLYRVGQVALLCGFSDEKYFSTAFKKEKGISPKEYTKTN